MSKLTKKQRDELRQMFGGKCAYCGCELPETAIENTKLGIAAVRAAMLKNEN